MTIMDTTRPTSSPTLWEVPRWATYMDLNEPTGSGDTGFEFSSDHGSISYYRDLDEGGHLSVEGELIMDFETRAVTIEFGEIEVRLCAGLGDNDHVFTVGECRAALAAFDQAPPALQPLVKLHAALRAVVEVADASGI
jgi:hypothetical protein